MIYIEDHILEGLILFGMFPKDYWDKIILKPIHFGNNNWFLTQQKYRLN